LWGGKKWFDPMVATHSFHSNQFFQALITP
jgi:hypothetical protein